MRRGAVSCIRFYRAWISPLKRASCRFWPTCSQYAEIAITRHGLVKGGALAIWRLVRCGPWHPGGYDPVPQSRDEKELEVQDGHIH